jgi:hypothetical protein
MLKHGRNLLKRLLAHVRALVTLGSVGITPRLAFAFTAVAALAATANLIVENGVSIIEQQHKVELERSANDLRAISTLRASMDRAQQVVTVAELQMSLDRFDRAARE